MRTFRAYGRKRFKVLTRLLRRKSESFEASLKHTIHLMAPRVQGQAVTFQWHIEPASLLYRRTHFSIIFPDFINLSRIPDRLWWDILLLCLHPHWLLLRPCEVRLPLKLGESLRQFWLQLLQNGADTLDVHGPLPLQEAAPLGITIVDGDLDVPYRTITGSGCGTAFSGGKDSLLQTGLLLELTERPLLVATTSPMPPHADHITARRYQVFEAIQTRQDLLFVETQSDFRSCWNNGFPSQIGYYVAVNELTDVLLYTSSLLAVGAALGVTRLFVASEAEVQVNSLIDRKIVQHLHFMYSAATQRSLARLLARYGFKFGSLNWPLHSLHVQQLLWARYPNICDLQYSCWRVREGQATCSACEQCLRIAVTALEVGHDPQRMGIDLVKLIGFASKWEPIPKRDCSHRLPWHDASDAAGAGVVDLIRRTSLTHLEQTLACTHLARSSQHDILKTVEEFRRLQQRFEYFPRPQPIGVREAFCDWLDPDFRDALFAIYTSYFPLEPRHRHFDIYDRSSTLTSRVTSSLD
jgi:hypothetical protein